MAKTTHVAENKMTSEEQDKKLKLTYFLLGGILSLALLLRVFALDKFPPELFGDEIDVGYHAYSLLHTAKDYTGQMLPTYIHSFNEWRTPLLMYATVPFVGLFGLNEWGVRLTPVFFGVLNVFLLYILVKHVTRRNALALAAALLLALSPWHIQFSRTAYEVTLLMTLLLLGAIGFLKSFQRPWWLLIAAGSFSLMPYTYSIGTLLMPLFLISLVAIYFTDIRQIPKRFLVYTGALFFIILLPYTIQTLIGQTGERFSKISIANNPQLINSIEIERNVPVFPPNSPFQGPAKELIEKVTHNRPVALANAFVSNYLQTFSTNFLFLKGDPNPRQSVGNFGEFHLFYLPLLAIGAYALIKSNNRFSLVVLALFILVPIPSALTKEGGTQATRLFLFNIPIVVTCAYGLVKFYDAARKQYLIKGLFAIFLVIAAFNMLTYMHRYYTHNPVDGYKFWQYGYKDGLSYIKQHQDEYEKILITNRGDPALGRTLFHLTYNPKKFHEQFTGDKPKPNILPGFDGFVVGNVYFVEVNEAGRKQGIENIVPSNSAYFISQEYEIGGDWDWRKDPPGELRALHTVLDPWQKPIFYVITKN